MYKIFFFALSLALISCNSKVQNDNKQKQEFQNKKTNHKLSGKQIISKLESLNFFKLTDEKDLKESKAEFEKSYNELDFFEGKMKNDSMIFTDHRFYAIDSEELFETGGLTDYLKIVKTSFDRLNLKLEISNEVSVQTENHWTHKIKLNGKEYIAFDNDFGESDWGISYINFLEMLNDQLKLQNSPERFYPISSNNDGRIVLLTKAQFEFVKSNYPIDKEHPMEISDWKHYNTI